MPIEGELLGLTHNDLDRSNERRRELQLDLIDTTNSQNGSTGSLEDPLVQLYFLKNRQSIYDNKIYSQVQSVVIQDTFYSILGDRLKDYPSVLKKTPLISLQFFTQSFEKKTKIYNIKDNTKVQLTELKISKAGYIYCMILDQNTTMEKNIMGLHVKYGIDANNAASVWNRTFLVDDSNWIIYFNIADLPFNGTKKNFTFYYYATDKRIGELVSVTPVQKIDFSIWKDVVVSRSQIWTFTSLILFLSLFWIN